MTHKTTMPKPDAYIFQHEETGRIHEVDVQQVEWGFEKNNPRLKLIGSLYSSEKMEAYADARVREALEAAEDAVTTLYESDDGPFLVDIARAINALIPQENES